VVLSETALTSTDGNFINFHHANPGTQKSSEKLYFGMAKELSSSPAR